MATMERDGPVFILNLGSGENRFNPYSVTELQCLLDEVEEAAPPAALVTCADGKYFSNGLDLDWIRQDTATRRTAVLRDLQDLYARLLCLRVPTVAAVQGHAFAGGAILGACHDVQVMRDGRGFWCLPEVNLGMAFTLGMTELLLAKLPMPAAHTALTTGHRYSGAEALAAGIVHAVAPDPDPDTVRACAVRRAEQLAGTAGPALGAIKQRMYAQVVRSLLADRFERHVGHEDRRVG